MRGAQDRLVLHRHARGTVLRIVRHAPAFQPTKGAQQGIPSLIGHGTRGPPVFLLVVSAKGMVSPPRSEKAEVLPWSGWRSKGDSRCEGEPGSGNEEERPGGSRETGPDANPGSPTKGGVKAVRLHEMKNRRTPRFSRFLPRFALPTAIGSPTLSLNVMVRGNVPTRDDTGGNPPEHSPGPPASSCQGAVPGSPSARLTHRMLILALGRSSFQGRFRLLAWTTDLPGSCSQPLASPEESSRWPTKWTKRTA